MDWHTSKKLQHDLLAFHEACASFPHAAVAEAQRHHVATMETLRGDLQEAGIALRFEYTGSTYEEIKVPSSSMKFNIMVVLSGGSSLKAEEIVRKPGFYTLSPKVVRARGPVSKFVDPNTVCLLPKEAARFFISKLQLAINKHSNLKSTINLRYHGPAVQMDVYHSTLKDFSNLFYSVDMVPSFHIPGKDEYYVAKPFKDENEEEKKPSSEDEGSHIAWRRSFSLEEKKIIKTIDDGNQCRKQCIRMLKVFRDNEPNLHIVNSYIIKTAVLSLSRDFDLDWQQKNLGQCFIDTLKYLARAFAYNKLNHYFIKEVNILEYIPYNVQIQIGNRFKNLVGSETKFYKALSQARAKSKLKAQWTELEPFVMVSPYEEDYMNQPEGAVGGTSPGPLPPPPYYVDYPEDPPDYADTLQKDQEEPSASSILAGGAVAAGAVLVGLGLGALFKHLSTDDEPTDRTRRK